MFVSFFQFFYDCECCLSFQACAISVEVLFDNSSDQWIFYINILHPFSYSISTSLKIKKKNIQKLVKRFFPQKTFLLMVTLC